MWVGQGSWVADDAESRGISEFGARGSVVLAFFWAQ